MIPIGPVAAGVLGPTGNTSAPGWWPSTLGHILGNACLTDIDADLEKLAVDARRPPEWIGDAHLADQLSYFERHRRPASTASRLPAPVQPETRAMPANDSVRLHDRQRLANLWKQPIETTNTKRSRMLNESLLGAVRRRTFICCRNVQISASSAARGRNRSTTAQPMSLKRSLITRQHRPILGQPPAR
jgi:hypothetical protein